ncbi:MAG: hypothetical protein ABL963_15430 [Longimicrobiales bacterium]
MSHRTAAVALIIGAGLVAWSPAPSVRAEVDPSPLLSMAAPIQTAPAGAALFPTSDRCLACHKGVTTSTGEDVSIGFEWRASMMANSARDPYWQAAVRREITDYPEAAGAIEDKCSRCHMPMASVVARGAGGTGSVFANLPVGAAASPNAALAADGVACAACHQIGPDGLGTEASYTGGFQVALDIPAEGRPAYGPFQPDSGGVGIMHSATGLRPTEGLHVQSSELCASCHTLFTHAVRPGGEGPEFPEQVPYLEWQSSAYATEGTSCQDCHMPLVGEDVPVTSVLGRARPEVSRHQFQGGNFFMMRMLDRYRGELGVTALPQEFALAAARTETHLREATVSLTVSSARVEGSRLLADVDVRNLAGHKFPTAYPSRRAWLHVTVTDARGRTVFESGAFAPDGRIVGNDNDQDPLRFEPHYSEVSRADQVQVYEAVMVSAAGAVTTGLMTADRWVKENRLLPRGFDAREGGARVAVRGEATSDADFVPGGDRTRYAIAVDPAAGPFTVEAELWFQPVAYRWAENLADYDTFETNRFVRYYRSMASGSAIPLASSTVTAR